MHANLMLALQFPINQFHPPLTLIGKGRVYGYEYTVSNLASYVPMPLGQVLREIWLRVVQPKKEPMA